jgi:RNA 2',3'-cyclic 3'-phosphodiesterase
MRLFVAVIPPARVLHDLTRAVMPLVGPGEADGLRWTRDEGRHITLTFLGEVGDGVLPGLTPRLARAAGRYAPLALRLSGAGRFGDRTLWAGVAGDTVPLSRLAASVTAGARRCGITAQDTRSFRAHLTLARNRGSASLQPYADALAALVCDPWTADRVELVRSHPPAPGVPGAPPRYETLDTWPLGR